VSHGGQGQAFYFAWTSSPPHAATNHGWPDSSRCTGRTSTTCGCGGVQTRRCPGRTGRRRPAPGGTRTVAPLCQGEQRRYAHSLCSYKWSFERTRSNAQHPRTCGLGEGNPHGTAAGGIILGTTSSGWPSLRRNPGRNTRRPCRRSRHRPAKQHSSRPGSSTGPARPRTPPLPGWRSRSGIPGNGFLPWGLPPATASHESRRRRRAGTFSRWLAQEDVRVAGPSRSAK
jgi:hypothetical protein